MCHYLSASTVDCGKDSFKALVACNLILDIEKKIESSITIQFLSHFLFCSNQLEVQFVQQPFLCGKG